MATGQDVVHCIKEWARESRFDLEGATAIVQGFGNVGSNTALLLSKLGVSTIATGDHTGYLRNDEGAAVLADRGIPVIPDILADSGGVTVSYYEWVQNRNSEHWDAEEVQRRLLHMMRRAYQRTMFYAAEKKVSTRIAAYALALESLATSYEERGISP